MRTASGADDNPVTRAAVRASNMTETTPPLELLGEVQSVLFENPETGYAVLRVQVRGQPLPVTVTGSLFGVGEGTMLKAFGTYKEHAKFGRQFAATRHEEVRPRLPEGMKRYLSSRLRGVGEKMAEKIVEHFGDRTYEILDADPGRVREVPGVGKKKATHIAEQWNEKRSVREADTFLQQYGVGPAQVMRLMRQYGDATVAMVKTNPYRLADEVRGIGFKTADRIALSMGMAKDSIERARAGLCHLVSEAGAEGHTLLPTQALLARAQALEIDEARAKEALEQLAAEKQLIVEDAPPGAPDATRVVSDGASPLDLNDWDRKGPVAYTPRMHHDERAIAALLTMRAHEDAPWKGAKDRVKGAARAAQIQLAPEQEEAVKQALEKKMSVITGGPGTGKTTIVRLLVNVLRQQNVHVRLAAPTGRAAKRLSEATGEEAMTIHRLLKYDPFRNAFVHDERMPLEVDHLVVDECSMVDAPLAASLLRALPEHAHVTFVGDADQLPSVGPGDVFRALCAAGTLPVTRLQRIFRQREGSRISEAAHAINHGELPEFDPPGRGGEMFFVERDDPQAAVDMIRTLVVERIPQAYGLNPRSDVQVLTPMHKGLCGAENLNEVLGKALNPTPTAEVERRGKTLHVGDRVVQIKNDYDRNVFNGDQGFIVDVNAALKKVVVRFDERDVDVTFEQLDLLLPAWATTVHRAQGGEHKAIVIALLNQHFVMLRRNLIYTAITRAKNLCVIVGSKRALRTAIQNGSANDRCTWLLERLRAGAATFETGADA